MPIIKKNENLATVIVSFCVEPHKQQNLISAVTDNSEKVMKGKVGFVSNAIHKSYDGRHLVNFAQWTNRTMYENAINFLTPEEVKIGEKIFEIAEADWHIYKLIEIISADRVTISKQNKIITSINILSVSPNDQVKLIEIWSSFLHEIVKNQQGFVCAAILRSVDGLRVISYSQWETDDAFHRVFSTLGAKSYLEKQKEISQSNLNFYEIVYTSD